MEASSLIRRDIVQKQLDRIPIKYPTLERFVRNKDLLEQVLKMEAKAIEENREDIIVNCDDFFFTLMGKKTQKDIEFPYPLPEIQKICRGAPHQVIHYHGVYLGFQSDDDAGTNSEILQKDGSAASTACAVGIDGIHCRAMYHDVRIPWSDEFYKRLSKTNGIMTQGNVKMISCKKIPANGFNVFWSCEVTFKDGKGSIKNMFNEVTYEHSNKDNLNQYAFQMLEGDEKRTVFANAYLEDYKDDDEVRCSVMHSKDNSRRVLSCFMTNVEG